MTDETAAPDDQHPAPSPEESDSAGHRADDAAEASPAAKDGEQKTRRVVVVGPDGQPVGQVDIPVEGESADDEKSVTDMVEQPAKVMRIGTMVKQLLEEVRSAPLDDASRQRLKEIYQRSITELEDGLAPELQEELERLSLPFSDEATPTDGELRIAQAQLVGWLEGLFHGIQTALFAQQMASRVALEQMRGGGTPPALPPGLGGAAPGQHRPDDPAPGQYL